MAPLDHQDLWDPQGRLAYKGPLARRVTRVLQGPGCQEPEVIVVTQDHGVRMGAQGQKGIVGQQACLGTAGSVGTRETLELRDPKETRVTLWWWRGRLEHGAARGSRETVA